jgi:hypothetical protein
MTKEQGHECVTCVNFSTEIIGVVIIWWITTYITLKVNTTFECSIEIKLAMIDI